MAEEKVLKPEEITNAPLPGQPTEGELPSRVPASGLRGSFFNSIAKKIMGMFHFTEKGGIKIGEFKQGIAGEIILDINGFHAIDTNNDEVIKLDSGGLHNYNASAQEIIEVDINGLHGYNVSSQEIVKVDSGGFHGYNTSGNELVKVDSEGFHGYKTSGVKTIKIDPSLGVEGYGTGGDTFVFRNQEGGTIYGQIGYLQSSASMYLAGVNGALVYLLGGGGLQLQSAGSTDANLQAGGKVLLKGADTGIPNSGGIFFYDYDGAGYVEKTAIIKTTQGFRALYCMESPEVWFMDFCWGRKKRKFPDFWKTEWVLKPDKLFLEVTSPPYIIVPTGQNNLVQLWGKRRGLESKRFERKTKAEFDQNNKFWGMAKTSHK